MRSFDTEPRSGERERMDEKVDNWNFERLVTAKRALRPRFLESYKMCCAAVRMRVRLCL